MTLLDEIKAKCTADVRASRDSQRIADQVNVGRVKPSSVKVGKGLIVRTIGLAAANTVLDQIDAAPDYRHVRHLLVAGELDAWDPIFQGALKSLEEQEVLSKEGATALLALGAEPDPVSEFDVRKACWSDAGEWLA